MTTHPSAKNNDPTFSSENEPFLHLNHYKERSTVYSKYTESITQNDEPITITSPKLSSDSSKQLNDHQLWTDTQNLKISYTHHYSSKFYAQKQRTHHYAFGFIRAHQFTTNINLPPNIFNTIFNYCYIDGVKDLLSPIPPLTIDMKIEIFIQRVNLCNTIFDFQNTISSNECTAIQNKKERLSEILDYIEMNDDIWSDKQILRCIMDMIEINLFRTLPFHQSNHLYDFENDNSFEDPQYGHLCYIYEIALIFVKCINLNKKSRKKFIGKTFVRPLIQLFASKDYREKQYIKAILHEIYARNIGIRKVIRKELCNCCYRIIYSEGYNEIENGIDECLQLMCSIFQGLNVPIKDEYIGILRGVLIPLHKVNMRVFNKLNESLLKCVIQLIGKDINIGLDILFGLIKFWPFQCAEKANLFLKEMIIIINKMMIDIHIDDIDNECNIFKYHSKGVIVREKVINKLIECIISDNYFLCERGLQAFSEDGVQKLIDINKEKTWNRILKILFDEKKNNRHWCGKLKASFDIVLNLFVNRDAMFVQQFEDTYAQMSEIVSINEFKEGFYDNGYNPIYPNKELLFNSIKKDRIEKYKKIEMMAERNRNVLLRKQRQKHKNGHKNGHNNGHRRNKSLRVPLKPAPKPPKPPVDLLVGNGKCKVIVKGFMLKRGKYNKAYKKRYFELKSNKNLHYYKKYDGNKGGGVDLKGVIDLQFVKRIVKIGENGLNIVALTREWNFLCKSRYERDYWYIIIVKLCMKSLPKTRPKHHATI